MHSIIKLFPCPPAVERKIHGTTLLEVMVALVIFSIGMLGLNALQVTGLRESGNADKRTQATLLANDLIERMRANPKGVYDGSYDDTLINYSTINCATPPAKYCEDYGSNSASLCASNEMASYDAYTVKCLTEQRLPTGTVTVGCTDNTGTAATCSTSAFRSVTIGWVNTNDFGTSTKTITFVLRP